MLILKVKMLFNILNVNLNTILQKLKDCNNKFKRAS
jgi:hypothetical protein